MADVEDWLRSEGTSDEVIEGLGDRLELGSVREVKGGGLGKGDLERLEAYLELVKKKPPAIVDGMRVEELVLVLNDPKKALSSPGVREELLEHLGEVERFRIETYDARGGRASFAQVNAHELDAFFEGLP